MDLEPILEMRYLLGCRLGYSVVTHTFQSFDT